MRGGNESNGSLAFVALGRQMGCRPDASVSDSIRSSVHNESGS